jgi:hypothetical protein
LLGSSGAMGRGGVAVLSRIGTRSAFVILTRELDVLRFRGGDRTGGRLSSRRFRGVDLVRCDSTTRSRSPTHAVRLAAERCVVPSECWGPEHRLGEGDPEAGGSSGSRTPKPVRRVENLPEGPAAASPGVRRSVPRARRVLRGDLRSSRLPREEAVWWWSGYSRAARGTDRGIERGTARADGVVDHDGIDVSRIRSGGRPPGRPCARRWRIASRWSSESAEIRSRVRHHRTERVVSWAASVCSPHEGAASSNGPCRVVSSSVVGGERLLAA